MKSIVLICISLLLFSCNQGRVNNLSTNEGIECKVKFISEFDYEARAKFGEITKDSLLFKITYKYDEKGNEIEENSYGSDENLISKMTYEYNNEGNAIESNRYNIDGSLAQRFVFKYNEQGKVSERNDYNADGSLDHKSTFKYNEEGKVIEKNNYYSDGSLDDKMMYNYNAEGIVIENIYFETGRKKSVLKFNYQFDKHGNWIIKNKYLDDKPIQI